MSTISDRDNKNLENLSNAQHSITGTVGRFFYISSDYQLDVFSSSTNPNERDVVYAEGICVRTLYRDGIITEISHSVISKYCLGLIRHWLFFNPAAKI